MDKEKLTVADLIKAFEIKFNEGSDREGKVKSLSVIGDTIYAIFVPIEIPEIGFDENVMSLSKKTGEFGNANPMVIGIDKLEKGIVWSDGKDKTTDDEDLKHSAIGRRFLGKFF